MAVITIMAVITTITRLGNRTLSTRPSTSPPQPRHKILTSLRASTQPPLSQRLFLLIKSSNSLISAYTTASSTRHSLASQLSDWGVQTSDPAISDLSDKIAVLLSELATCEESYASSLDDARRVLKTIRNTEKSVQPSRDARQKLVEEIGKLKGKGGGEKLAVLEQELVRAEAEGLVAEAQLYNVTRTKLKEAYRVEFLAGLERAEKTGILVRHGLRLLELLDDEAVVPGDEKREWEGAAQARQVLNDAEDDLRAWRFPEGLLQEGEGSDFGEVGIGRGEVENREVDKGKGKEVERVKD
ncbi:hypothetical protein OQA88_3753 [Cercophora sp. LCS_1]